MQISRLRLSDKTSRLHLRHVVPKPAQAYEPEAPVEVAGARRPLAGGTGAGVCLAFRRRQPVAAPGVAVGLADPVRGTPPSLRRFCAIAASTAVDTAASRWVAATQYSILPTPVATTTEAPPA